MSVAKQIFTMNQIVEMSLAHLFEKILAGSLPRKLPIVDLDHNQVRLVNPVGIFCKKISLTTFDVNFHDEKFTMIYAGR